MNELLVGTVVDVRLELAPCRCPKDEVKVCDRIGTGILESKHERGGREGHFLVHVRDDLVGQLEQIVSAGDDDLIRTGIGNGNRSRLA